jgi:hypothetical protein
MCYKHKVMFLKKTFNRFNTNQLGRRYISTLIYNNVDNILLSLRDAHYVRYITLSNSSPFSRNINPKLEHVRQLVTNAKNHGTIEETNSNILITHLTDKMENRVLIEKYFDTIKISNNNTSSFDIDETYEFVFSNDSTINGVI